VFAIRHVSRIPQRGDTTLCATVFAVTDRLEELGVVCSFFHTRSRPNFVLDIVLFKLSPRKAHSVLMLGIGDDLSFDIRFLCRQPPLPNFPTSIPRCITKHDV
jgi:hypothetical protein